VNIHADALVLLETLPDTLPEAGCVAAWSLRDVPANVDSVPALVDQAAVRLRDEYITWIHDLGAYEVRGRDVRTRLALTPDLSFWWMTLVAEKEPLRSPGIYKVFKLRTLELLYHQRGCRGVVYVGNDRVLAKVLRRWCSRLGHPYSQAASRIGSRRTANARGPSHISERFPYVCQAAWYLGRTWFGRIRRARRAAAIPSGSGAPRATIVTFFPNVDLERTRGGRFWSRYWERLHELLDESQQPIDWLWLYVSSPQVSFDDTLVMLETCNQKGRGQYRYLLFDQFIRPAVLVHAAAIYVRVVFAALRLGPAKRAFRFPGSDLDFFPMMSHEWRSSLFGLAAAQGALQIAGFDEVAEQLPGGPWMLFLWENQPWELALMTAWRRKHAGRIIGAQHSALGSLDLRSFGDPRDLSAGVPVRRPAPDLLAVNGSGARDLLTSYRPANHIVVAEALRYLQLRTVPPANADGKPPMLLVLTGYKQSETVYQLRLLSDAAQLGALDRFARVVIKPHPVCPIEPLIRPGCFARPPEIATTAVTALWPEAHVVFAANSTAAAVEASYVGLPVAVCAAADEMNLSPAFGQLNVPVVGTAAELAEFLRHPTVAVCPRDYFLLDDALPRWRELLSVS
jgi:surface carbohydrate biosynthesis protein (TIGR04326 family)